MPEPLSKEKEDYYLELLEDGDEKAKDIMNKKAVGEAFGHYFNKKGEIVYKLNTVGIDMESFKNKRETIAVFAGRKKAEAFIPISKINKNIVLITDEESAKEILKLG